MQYQEQAYDWDDIPEPTDEELAEVDAAIAAAPDVDEGDPLTGHGALTANFCEWARARGLRSSPTACGCRFCSWKNSYPVRQALKRVGDPDGTDDWGYRFAKALIEATENAGRIRTVADRMAYLAAQWNAAMAVTDNRRPHRSESKFVRRQDGVTVAPVDLLRQMVDLLPLPAVARYLGLTEHRVTEWLFPCTDVVALRYALTLYRSGQGIQPAAKHVGISHNILRAYLRALQEPATVTVTSNGKRVMPPAVRQRIADLAATGLTANAVLEQLRKEMPESVEGIRYAAVNMAISRARRQAAA